MPITQDDVGAVFDLQVAPEQAPFVAPNPWSLAQALAQHDVAWPRAIVAEGEVVGFAMLEIDPDSEWDTPFYLWRLMVDHRHQRRGHGRAAVRLLVEEVARRGGLALHTSWREGDAGPRGFYESIGFVPTGRITEGETEAVLAIVAA